MPCCSSVGINTFGAALGCVYVCCGGGGGGGGGTGQGEEVDLSLLACHSQNANGPTFENLNCSD